MTGEGVDMKHRSKKFTYTTSTELARVFLDLLFLEMRTWSIRKSTSVYLEIFK